jgi:hypothetical protein
MAFRVIKNSNYEERATGVSGYTTKHNNEYGVTIADQLKINSLIKVFMCNFINFFRRKGKKIFF